MDNLKIEVYLEQVQNAINTAINNALEEAVGAIEGQTKMNTRVDTSKTKGSWTHYVDEKKHIGYIGSNYENAIWEEFGTGIYALEGNGRKDVPWTYQTPDGKWHRTKGKKPSRAFFNAYTSVKPSIESYFKSQFGANIK